MYKDKSKPLAVLFLNKFLISKVWDIENSTEYVQQNIIVFLILFIMDNNIQVLL